MAGITFSGKSAVSVATRSPQLGLPGVAETQRAERRAKETDRLDRHIQAARWRGEQVAFLRERVRRLEPVLAGLCDWLDHHPYDHPLWPKRIDRYWQCAHTIAAHEREMRGFIDKVDDLVRTKFGSDVSDATRKKHTAMQERITAAYFQALSATPPAHRPARVGMMET
jgi:hypothetical protein